MIYILAYSQREAAIIASDQGLVSGEWAPFREERIMSAESPVVLLSQCLNVSEGTRDLLASRRARITRVGPCVCMSMGRTGAGVRSPQAGGPVADEPGTPAESSDDLGSAGRQ